MGHIEQNNFSAGWIPSDDALNGRRNGLVDFSNLTLDENGAISLANGTSKVNSGSFSTDVNSIYSRIINGVKHRYVGLLNGNIIKDTGGGSFATTVVTDASSEKAAYGTAFGQIFACKGTVRKKDNGSTITNLGVGAPTAQVTIAYPAPPAVDVSGISGGTYGNWESVETSSITNSNAYILFNTSLTSFRGITQVKYGGGSPAPIDTTALSGGSVGTEDDSLFFDINISDSSKLVKVRLEFFLTYPGLGGAGDPAAKDYFFFEWVIPDETFKEGAYQQSTLSCARRDFTKVGDDPSLNWKSIACMRLTVEATDTISVAASNFEFQGGTKGPLNGAVEYTQVNINNTGSYLAASNYGPISAEILDLKGTYLTITPQTPADAQVNEVWIYRRGGTLDRWYRVKVLTSPYAAFSDQLSDEDALLVNEALDERLISVQSIPDAIRGIEGPFFGRVLYMTYKEIYSSLLGNPDICNSAATLLTSGSLSEVNLFITKVSNSVIFLGTTNDIYEISGTFEDLPDGFVDVTIRPLGLSKPPISDAFVNNDGTLVYMAEDGWRALRGNTSELLTANLDLLYRGQTRYGTVGVNVVAQNNIQFSCCLSKGRLFTSQFLTNGSSTVFVYDFIRQYWRRYDFAVNQLFAEEDGTVLGGYYGSGNRFLKILDTGTTIDGSGGLPLTLKTCFFDDGLSRNRKDSFTLKLVLDTGNTNLTLNIYKDLSTTPAVISTSLNGNGLQEKFFNLSPLVGVAKYYQMEITGTTSVFKLLSWSIDYEPRPTQLTYLRIPPTNFGTAGRKRLAELPIRIDTLGSSIRYSAIVDGTALTPVIISSTDAAVKNYQFTSEIIGTNFSGIVDSVNGDVYFEFYEVVQPRAIEILPDPVKWLRIPNHNLGTVSRKRFVTFPIVIDTRGQNVTFIPEVDGVAQPAATINTTGKRTFTYYFSTSTVGVDLGGTLSGSAEFEFYSVAADEAVSEKLPPAVKFLTIPSTNFGTASKKRLRTIPLVIDTKGSDVIFTPMVDGVNQPISTLNSARKRTLFHYFNFDVFGIDIEGTLSGLNDFEFYGILTPETVEVLPVGKLFDQIGPIEFNKLGKLLGFRLKILPTGPSIPYTVYMGDTSIATGTLSVVANKEDVYERKLVKSISGTMCRIVFGPTTDVFHRLDCELRVNLSGSQTESRLIRVQ